MYANHSDSTKPLIAYIDTRRMKISLRHTDYAIDLDIDNFRNYQELMRNHNTVLDQYNAYQEYLTEYRRKSEEERNKELEKRRAKVDKERQTYNYEDDEYIIRLPENLSELSAEGKNLRHCVGGYLNSHSRGDTTIMFLRKKTEPDKSFYTIEVAPNGSIRQIHGFGNKWLGNNPEAIPSVMKWLRNCKLTCDAHILTCTATGYGGNGNHVALPVI
jgi:hypothetical protein